MRYEIDLAGIYNPDDFYNRLEEYMPLPEYFGRNLDALHDMFTDIATETEIVFTSTREAEVMMSRYMRNLKRLCTAVQKENENLRFTFDA